MGNPVLYETKDISIANALLHSEKEKWVLIDTYHATHNHKECIVYVLGRYESNDRKHIPKRCLSD